MITAVITELHMIRLLYNDDPRYKTNPHIQTQRECDLNSFHCVNRIMNKHK